MSRKRHRLPGAGRPRKRSIAGLLALVTALFLVASPSQAAPEPSVTLTADDSWIFLGESVGLRWSSTGMDEVRAGLDWSQRDLPQDGNTSLTPPETGEYTYRLTGYVDGDVAESAQVTVEVRPAPTLSLTPEHAEITLGESVLFSWTSTTLTHVFAEGDPWPADEQGRQELDGTISVTPTEPGEYTYLMWGAYGERYGVEEASTVTVLPVADPPQALVTAGCGEVTFTNQTPGDQIAVRYGTQAEIDESGDTDEVFLQIGESTTIQTTIDPLAYVLVAEDDMTSRASGTVSTSEACAEEPGTDPVTEPVDDVDGGVDGPTAEPAPDPAAEPSPEPVVTTQAHPVVAPRAGR